MAVKQIALKSVPGKLSNIRQKEIAILKVGDEREILLGSLMHLQWVLGEGVMGF